jgi:hypothetical protein
MHDKTEAVAAALKIGPGAVLCLLAKGGRPGEGENVEIEIAGLAAGRRFAVTPAPVRAGGGGGQSVGQVALLCEARWGKAQEEQDEE